MCGSERESEWIEQSIVSEGEEEEGKKLQSIRWVVACHSSSKCLKHFSSKHISQPSCCHPKATEDPALPFICQRRRRRAFLCIGSQPERKSLLLQITNSLSHSALALHFCQRWKDLHLTHHPLANCVCKGCENGLWPFVVCGWGLLRPSIC